jgi:hypothetical protein
MTTPAESLALLERIAELSEKATPGPWKETGHEDGDFILWATPAQSRVSRIEIREVAK